jgi:hypothetical protein
MSFLLPYQYLYALYLTERKIVTKSVKSRYKSVKLLRLPIEILGDDMSVFLWFLFNQIQVLTASVKIVALLTTFSSIHHLSKNIFALHNRSELKFFDLLIR